MHHKAERLKGAGVAWSAIWWTMDTEMLRAGLDRISSALDEFARK